MEYPGLNNMFPDGGGCLNIISYYVITTYPGTACAVWVRDEKAISKFRHESDREKKHAESEISVISSQLV